MIAHQQALALRRSLLVLFGLGATLAAHAYCSGGVAITLAAPMAWGSLGCLALIVGARRHRVWREWSPLGLLVRIVVVELVLHVALTAAPWAFGIQVHHAPALLAPTTLLAHGAAGLVLALALMTAQHILSAAQRFVQALRRALRMTGAAFPSRAATRLSPDALVTAPQRRAHGARGPPLPAV